MGSISFGSVNSGAGLDVGAIVDQLIYTERAPARQLEFQKLLLDAQAAAARDINTKLQTLETAANDLKDLSGKFNSKSVTSSNTAVLTASADATAATAVHTVTVTSLATTSSYYSSQLADGSTPFAEGSFDLTVGTGLPTTITVDATNNTLDGLAAHINGLDLGVTASVITDANGARLSILSDSSGAPGDLTIASNTTGLTFTKAASGTNAALTVNGVPISSTSNAVSGVIAGVTLELASAAPATTVTISVKPDTEKAREAIDEFVTAYNDVVKAINAQFTVNTATNSAPPLFSDTALRLVQENILSAASYAITDNSGFVSLSTIGVNTQNDGTLLVDSTKLDNALSGNFTEVKNLFQQSTAPVGLAQNFSTVLDALNDSVDGPLNVALKGISDSQRELTDQIEAFDVRLESRRQALTEQFNYIDTLLRQLPVILQQVSSQLGTL